MCRWFGLALLVSSVMRVTAAAEDFRIETDVTTTSAKMHALTLFEGDMVYDFVVAADGEAAEIAIFDTRRGEIVLIDANRRLKTELTTDDLLSFTAALKALAIQDPGKQFGTTFNVKVDRENRSLKLSGKSVQYEVEGSEPEQPETVRKYFDFADWYARLNSIRPGTPPPFARLELNRHLVELGWLPAMIRRTVVIPRLLGDDSETVSSVHRLTRRLSTTDRKRIESAGEKRATFQKVDRLEFFRQS